MRWGGLCVGWDGLEGWGTAKFAKWRSVRAHPGCRVG